MLKHYFLYLCISLVAISCQSNKKQVLPIVQHLHTDWTFQTKHSQNSHSATVPGNIFTDLLNNELIEDPFIKNNEEKVQWVSDSTWVYQTNFTVGFTLINKDHIQLHFEGLDTYSKVYLNNTLILSSKNAFRHYHIPIKSLLKSNNTLRIEFTPTSKIEALKKHQLPYELPEGDRVFTRKAQFQYGWDWGPKLNTVGIWKPIYLKAWDTALITDIYISQETLTSIQAQLMAHVTIASDVSKEAQIAIQVDGQTILKTISLHKGTHTYMVPISIDTPKLWWTHNLGDPFLYNFEVQLLISQKILDQKTLRKGIRILELVTQKDSIGQSFYFKLNGVPVYMKGANYIPQNSFQNKVTSTHYNKLLNDVVTANMNMLRVWGGGIYENDIFYELCDEKGILIWQDFMFACAMYPGDQQFLTNVEQEAVDQVKRLRKYSSIALWCGNNESAEGWHRWGWQEGRTAQQKKEIWNNYSAVFDSILPQTVQLYTQTSYWESSPKFGRGNPKYITEGDAHDWWVWHDAYPFEHFETHIPRFMSEFGFQAFPSYETIRYINQKDSIAIHTKAMETHQKHARGFSLINTYMNRDYNIPKKDEDYVYVSQLLQAKGIVMGIEAQRRNRPYTMGSLYWQLNDCWPVVSWSSIDYFGQWKALHYKAKKAYENLLVSTVKTKDTIQTYIVNDKLTSHTDTLHIELLDFYGKVLWKKSKKITVPQNTSVMVYQFPKDSIRFSPTATFLKTQFQQTTSHFFFSKPKLLQLPKGKISYQISKNTNGFTIILSSEVFQKDVFLSTRQKGHFSDNFFDLLPHVPKKIHFSSTANSLKDLSIKSLSHIEIKHP